MKATIKFKTAVWRPFGPSSFETRPSVAPQDEVIVLHALVIANTAKISFSSRVVVCRSFTLTAAFPLNPARRGPSRKCGNALVSVAALKAVKA
jgi:hypothetical protein